MSSERLINSNSGSCLEQFFPLLFSAFAKQGHLGQIKSAFKNDLFAACKV